MPKRLEDIAFDPIVGSWIHAERPADIGPIILGNAHASRNHSAMRSSLERKSKQDRPLAGLQRRLVRSARRSLRFGALRYHGLRHPIESP
jgi:hypothetical protein